MTTKHHLTIETQFPTELNPNKRHHWAKLYRLRKTARETAYYLTKNALNSTQTPKPTPNSTITLTIEATISNRHKTWDEDNLIAALKPTRDGIADALETNDKYFQTNNISWSKGTQAKLTIHIEYQR